MSAPAVVVNLIVNGGAPFDMAPYIDVSDSFEITDAIESPHETNEFVAPDFTLKGYDDASLTVTNKLKDIPVNSTAYQVQIWLDGVKQFDGFVLPNTVQFDQQERSFQFGAVGIAKRLALTSAEGLFHRTGVTGWVLAADTGSTGYDEIAFRISNPALPQTCPFATGDIIHVLSPVTNEFGWQTGVLEDDYTISGVAPVGSAPFASWSISVTTPFKQQYKAGATVTLKTVYQRNVPLRTAVTGLFNAAGLTAPTDMTYSVIPINGDTMLASAPVLDGLDGTPVGVAPLDTNSNPTFRKTPIVGGTKGTYTQANAPLGSWTLGNAAITTAPADSSMQYPTGHMELNQGKMLYGPRVTRQRTGITSGGTGGSHTATYYVYAYSVNPLTRYSFEIASADEGTTTPAWSWTLRKETSADGYNWGGASVLASASGTTDSTFIEYIAGGKTFGLTRSGRYLYFCEPYNSGGAGSALVFRISMWDTIGAALTTGVANRKGIPYVTQRDISLVVFALDSIESNSPAAYSYEIQPGGALAATGLSAVPLPDDFQPHTLKWNAGDESYYGLAASRARGVRLYNFGNSNLTFQWQDPVQLAAPSPSIGDVDLCVLWIGTPNGGVPFPMYALFGDVLWWVDTAWTSIIPYLDLSGMTCADALAQLATLVDGYYYVDGTGAAWFRTRSNAASQSVANPSGINSDVLDDGGCLSLKTQPIWVKCYRYVSVTNENDDTVTGSAGSTDFANDQTLSLQLTNRYVSTLSFAHALAGTIFGYLGDGVRVVELQHTDDGRRYYMGYTFRATVDGVQRQFQIIQTRRNPVSGLIDLVGIEL